MARFSLLCCALTLGAAACGGPQRQGGDGATCFRDDECAFGLVCAPPPGGTARTCTSDVTGLISLVDAGLPSAGAAGSVAGGGAGGNGGAAAGTAGTTGGAASTGGSSTGGSSTGGSSTGGSSTGGSSTTGGSGGV